MIELATLWFRAVRAQWNKEEYFYYFEFPKAAYFTKEQAEAGLPANEVVVSWNDMALRVAADIHSDA